MVQKLPFPVDAARYAVLSRHSYEGQATHKSVALTLGLDPAETTVFVDTVRRLRDEFRQAGRDAVAEGNLAHPAMRECLMPGAAHAIG